MSVTVINPATHVRPFLNVTADLATAWGRVQDNSHALRRSIYPGERPTGLLLDDCEPVPELGYVTLRAWEPAMQSMPAGSYNDTTHWRRVATPATRGVHWYQYTVAAPNQAVGYSRPPFGYYLEPGVMIRVRSYGLPAGQTAKSYVRWQFQDADDNSTPFNLIWLRAYPGASGDEREGWYITSGTSDVLDYYSGGPSLTPGADVQMRVRVIEDHVIVSGQGFGSPWVVKLTDGTCNPLHDHLVWCHVAGGMLLWHCNPMNYVESGTVVEASTAGNYYSAPSHVVLPATSTPSATATFRPAQGSSGVAAAVTTSGTDTYLRAALSGTKATSPKLIALTEHRAPVQKANVSSSIVLDPAPVSCEISLNAEGRGQTCRLVFADRSGANQSALAYGGVVTVAGHYDDGSAAVTLFKGVACDPISYSKAESSLQDYEVGLVDAAWLLDRKAMLTMGGTFSGQSVADGVAQILAAAGIASSRVTVATDTQTLMPDGGDNLRFAPDETPLRALDTLCKARGSWVWGCDRDGDFYAGPRSSYGTDRGTLQDSSVAFLTYIHEITHEQQLSGDFANSIAVLTERRGKPRLDAYVPTPGAEGHDYWYVTQEDCDNGTVRARELAESRGNRLRTVSWSQHIDFANLVSPMDTYTTGTLAGIDLGSGLTLRVETVTYRLNLESDDPAQWAQMTIIATVEE